MQITRGKLQKAQKILIYGPEGIGKSTFASQFPNPLFIDTEGSTSNLDVARLDNPTSWSMLNQQIEFVKNSKPCKTLVIDTIDWAERLATSFVTSRANKQSITSFGYGEGFIQLEEEFGKFLNKLSDVIDTGINVVLTAHAKITKFEQPDEMGSYDRWELKLGNKTTAKTAALAKEWADMVLFANYKTYVINVDGKGAEKGKNKAQGGARVMYTTHHTCWDAKNRHNLKDELPFDYKEIAHCIPSNISSTPAPSPAAETRNEPSEPVPQETMPAKDEIGSPVMEPEPETEVSKAGTSETPTRPSYIPQPLYDLMMTNNVTEAEIRAAVAYKKYYTEDTPISNYDPNFINGVLIAAWVSVFETIKDLRKLPFKM